MKQHTPDFMGDFFTCVIDENFQLLSFHFSDLESALEMTVFSPLDNAFLTIGAQLSRLKFHILNTNKPQHWTQVVFPYKK